MDEQIKSIFSAVLGIDAASVDDSLSARTNSLWDSLKHIKLLVALEEEFSIEFSEEETQTLTSYVAIREAIVRRLPGSSNRQPESTS